MAKVTPNIPNVDPAKLRAVVENRAAIVRPDNSTPGYDYCTGAIHWLKDWLRRNKNSKATGVAVFIYVENLARIDTTVLSGFTKVPLFREAYQPDLCDNVFLTNDTFVVTYAINVAFKDATEAGKWLEGSKWKDSPTVIFKIDQRAVIFADSGIAKEGLIEMPLEVDSQIDPQNMVALLEHFHEHFTKTSNGWCDVWLKASKRILRQYPERLIAKALMAHLKFSGQRVVYPLFEVATTAGRIDLLIAPLRPAINDGSENTILELKVTKNKRLVKGKEKPVSENANVRWLKSGVRQAVRYKRRENAKEASLCCFDARTKNTCPADFPKFATDNDCGFLRFYMDHGLDDAAVG
jgi:hypothetical protein